MNTGSESLAHPRTEEIYCNVVAPPEILHSFHEGAIRAID